jgi:hypothetical protein
VLAKQLEDVFSSIMPNVWRWTTERWLATCLMSDFLILRSSKIGGVSILYP